MEYELTAECRQEHIARSGLGGHPDDAICPLIMASPDWHQPSGSASMAGQIDLQ
jgi:hypothetical protein